MTPMTNAERQRKYREKLKQEPEKYNEKKKKHREYMKAKRKPIAELTEKEKEKKRREWRVAKQNKKCGGVTKPKKTKECCELNARLCSKLKKQIIEQKRIIENMSLQNRALKKQIYRHKIKIRELCELPANLEMQNNISSPQAITEIANNSLQYTLQTKSINTTARLVDIFTLNCSSGVSTINNEPLPAEKVPLIEPQTTPLTKTLSFINENIPTISTPEKNRVKKKILQLNVMNASLQSAYKTHDNKSKHILKDIVTSETVEKYNMKTEISKSLGLKGRVRKYKTKVRKYKEAQEIRDFFNRDDNTRMTAGKKESIGRGQFKLQKRFLLTSVKKLYKKYVCEGGKASFSTFRRNKPRDVVRPKLSDRNTVACIKHSNLAFKAAQLKKSSVLGTADLEELLASSVCSIESYDCMYLNCENCKNKVPDMNMAEITSDTECTWIQWVRKAYTFEKGKDRKIVTTKRYVKDMIRGPFSKLKETFLSEMRIFRQHVFNINHQHKMFRQVTDHLLTNEAALIIDFSENYSCKLAEEIQALHFGVSKGQITIHTGVVYIHKNKISFASLSDCNDHDPGAIRAHIEPIIELIKCNPDIDTIHFFSDGPCTQYRQKKNFYQMSELCKKYKFVFGTWSFFEAAHGKGAADGVGGGVKRLLDDRVACGADVSCAEDAVSILNEESSVKIFSISENQIKHAQNQIPDDLNPVPGTNRLHQITYHVPSSTLRYRNISCFCESSLPRGTCECYNLKTHILRTNKATQSLFSSPGNPEVEIDAYGTLSSDEENKNPNFLPCEKASKKQKAKKVGKNLKMLRRISSSSEESTELTMSVHSDSDIIDILDDVSDVTFCEDEENGNIIRIADDIEATIWEEIAELDQNSSMEKYREEIDTDIKDEDVKKIAETKNVKTDSETSKKLQKRCCMQSEAYLSSSQEKGAEVKKESIDFKSTKEKVNIKNTGEIKKRKTNVEDSTISERKNKGETEKRETDLGEMGSPCDKRVNERENAKEIKKRKPDEEVENPRGKRISDLKLPETSGEIWYVDDIVIVGYYIRKTWKYYCGIIEAIDNLRHIYTIVFYKTIKKDKLKFIKTGCKDRDQVPYFNIIKKVSMVKIKENPDTYVLDHEEDTKYF